MKKKKIFLLSLCMLALCGCADINKTSIDVIAKRAINSKYKSTNKYMRGYKYYLPIGVTNTKVDDYNQVLESKETTFYMYVDILSYYNKKAKKYSTTGEGEFVKFKDGMIHIKEENGKKLVKIEHNYVSIEFISDDANLKKSLSHALVIISSIKYNNDAIKQIIDEVKQKGEKEIIDIFGNKDQTETDILEYDESYSGDEEADYDPDVIG